MTLHEYCGGLKSMAVAMGIGLCVIGWIAFPTWACLPVVMGWLKPVHLAWLIPSAFFGLSLDVLIYDKLIFADMWGVDA